MLSFVSSGRWTGPLTTLSRRIAVAPRARVAALVLTSALLAACSESPIAPAADAPDSIVKRLTATTNDGPYTITGTSSYSNEMGVEGASLNYITFATTLGSSWDDIKITHGSTVITENFNTGSWNTANFQVVDPANYPGLAVGGAYFSSGCECNDPNNSRGQLRTKAQFAPSAASPLTIEATYNSNPAGEDMSFLRWRSAGITPIGFESSLALTIHNWDGYTPIRNFEPDGQFGAGFYVGAVRIKVIDDGTNVTVTFTKLPPVVVENTTPAVTNVAVTPNPAVMTTASYSVVSTITDNGTVASATATIDGGSPITLTPGSGSTWTGTWAQTLAPDVYDVCVTATDDAGLTNTPSCTLLAVYDPNGGFVTGGGWITSPEGAFRPNTALTGKANFGFVSKYEKGKTIPTGNTSFQFDIAGLSFASTSYEWLVVQGTSTSATKTAQYKGAGRLTIGGVLQSGSYGFMLWAQDGTPDSFRIKITDPSGTTVYDNKVNELTGAEFGTAITGGSIIVHIPKK